MLVTGLCFLSAAIAASIAWMIAARLGAGRDSRGAEHFDGAERSLAASGAGTFVAYPERGFVRCSPATLQIVGLPSDDGIVRIDHWIGLAHAEDHGQVISRIAAAIEGGEAYTLDYRMKLGAERTIWVRTHVRPARTADGEQLVYGALLDITKVKQLELEVLARDARLRDASKAARFYTWELDLERMEYTLDRPVDAPDSSGAARNETYVESVEASRANHHPDDRPIFSAMIERLRTEDVPCEIEGRVMHPDGTYHWMLAHGKLVDEPGPRRVRGILQDIEVRKQAALRLQAVEARLERVMRGTNDGMWEIICATGALWVSPRFAEMLGYDQSEILGDQRRLFDLTHPEDRARVKQLTQANYFDLEFRMRRKDGEHRVMRIRGMCERDAEGRPVTVSGSQQDVTERNEYQRALIEARKAADAASMAKSEFLANMSHEIRTPMNGVIGMTSLLLETELNHEQRDYAETVRDSASSLLTVINDILDFSKVEAGKLEIESIDMDLRDTVEDAARLLAVQAHVKGLEVTAYIDPSIPSLVKGDAGRLRQILLNLGGNAVKFTSQGEVGIDVRVVSQDERGVAVRCEVRDTGIGIPADRIGSLFKPFSQIDASTTRKFGGTGLGLSIVKRLVELMEGDAGVVSTEGSGSTFWFTARLGVSTEKNLSRPEPPADLRGRRVLIVDDSATNRKVLRGQLALCGVDAVCLGSAGDAILALHEAAAMDRPFEIALLDHQMPGCDGEELGAGIREDSALKATRLVLLTSSGQRSDARRFEELGFAGYLLKPVTQRDLQQCLTLALAPASEQKHGIKPEIVTSQLLQSQRGREIFRILLAEDNVVNQKVACRILQKLGYSVDVVPDGRAAVGAWGSGRYHLILMDCQMPELDGYEATREIRALEVAGSRIPIIALTAHAMKGAGDECTRAGMDEHLSKPIDRDRLEACLARFLCEAKEGITNAGDGARGVR